jgi:putative membrane protein
MQPSKTLFTARFNPIIKTYILLYVAGILLITIIGIPLMLIWLLGLGQWYSRHYFQRMECELTENNLRFKKGIILQVEKTIPLENIQDMTFIEGPILKAFNLTIVKVETAGQSMHQANQMSLIGIIDSEVFRSLVLEQRQKIIQSRGSSGQKNNLEEIAETLKRIEVLLKDQNLNKS